MTANLRILGNLILFGPGIHWVGRLYNNFDSINSCNKSDNVVLSITRFSFNDTHGERLRILLNLVQEFIEIEAWLLLTFFRMFIKSVKVGLSASKKIFFVCTTESHLKLIKNAFCFIFKALFVLKISKFFLQFLVM